MWHNRVRECLLLWSCIPKFLVVPFQVPEIFQNTHGQLIVDTLPFQGSSPRANQRWAALVQELFGSVSAMFITWDWTVLIQLWAALKIQNFRARNQRRFSLKQNWTALIFSETELITAEARLNSFNEFWFYLRQRWTSYLFSAKIRSSVKWDLSVFLSSQVSAGKLTSYALWEFRS